MVAYSIIFLFIISLYIIAEGRIQIASLPDAHDTAINQIIALVPDNATVTTSNVIFPHLCSRTDTFIDVWEMELMAPLGSITNAEWGFPEKDTEYIVIDNKNNPWPGMVVNLISKKYKLLKIIDGVELYQLNY